MGLLAHALGAGFIPVLSFSAQAGPCLIWFADGMDVFQVSAGTNHITQTVRFGELDNGQAEATRARAGQ